MQSLGVLPGGSFSSGTSVSADGSAIAGLATSSGGNRAFRWTAAGGMQDLGVLAGQNNSFGTAINADGSVVTGYSYSGAPSGFGLPFRWTANGGMQSLGLLTETSMATAGGISADGLSIVGQSISFSGSTPFLWTPALGLVDLSTYLPTIGVDLTDWRLVGASGISADGLTIVGNGYLNGEERGYIVTLAQPPRWTADADGVWSSAANWHGGVPDDAGAEANFLDDVTAPRTITNDSRHRVGSIVFDSAHAYTLTGGAGLTLMGSGGEPARITVRRGSHQILNPTPVSSDVVIDVQPAESSLRMTSLPGGAHRVTKIGGGTFQARTLQAADLEIDEGTVAITAGETQFSGIAVDRLHLAGETDAWTATLDLADSRMAILADAATREAVLRRTMNQVRSARNGAVGGDQWSGTGITSSAAAENSLTGLAVILNDSGDGTPIFDNFAGRSVDANAVLTMYTWNGDANLDGRVNADDYFRIDSGFLSQPTDPLYSQGDFNYDGKINADDYFLIDSAFIGQTGTLGSAMMAVAVPEPAAITLLTCAALAGLIRPRVRRK